MSNISLPIIRSAYEENAGAQQDPACLTPFTRACEMVKHVAGKALSGGTIGALIGGGVALVLGAAGGAALSAVLLPIPVIGWVLAPIAAPIAAVAGGSFAAVSGAASAGAILGAKIGALVGGTAGLSGASEAADDEEQRRITLQQQHDVRQERMAALAMQRERWHSALAQQAQDLSPRPGNLPLPTAQARFAGLRSTLTSNDGRRVYCTLQA